MCPVGLGEMWRRLFAKIVLKVTVPEESMVCQDDHLCSGVKAGIDSTVHGVQAIWDENLTTYDWVFLIVDAKNTFNKINQVVMMWTGRHLWPPGYRFVLSCYRHWLSLILQNSNGKTSFLHSREGTA